ncbi:LrgA family protein [Burkholderiales bacterium GJ-E10]|nr:LrgA family protein [Burkholderiales bacterium GJ-E10]
MAFLVLLGFQLLGEVIRSATHVPLPGPVIGMFLLTVALVWRGRDGEVPSSHRTPLSTAAHGLIRNMGLLFVPAGVGIMAEAPMLQREWAPILAGVVGSTILGIIATGTVMHHATRRAGNAAAPAEPESESRPPQAAGEDA